MKRTVGSSILAPCQEQNRPGKPTGGQQILHDRETCQDIVRIAQSLGFSPRELLEIRRLYQAMPERRSK